MVITAAVAGLLAVGAQPAGALLPPLAPGDVRVTVPAQGAVTLSFTDNANNEEGFDIQRIALPNGTWTTVGTVRDHRNGQPQATSVRYSLPEDYPASTAFYCFRVKAFNSAGSRTSAEACPPRPDLAFNGSIVISPAHPDSNEPFTIRWTACNIGGSHSAHFEYKAALGNGDAIIAGNSTGIEQGTCETRTVSYFNGLPVGMQTVVVTLDWKNTVFESNESNNTSSISF
jgi:hypothetical protein